jgi:hypothetical protein
MLNKQKLDTVGYLDRPDSMRDFAEKNAYSCGGKAQKKAAGGVAKIRHGQSTASGMQKDVKKVSDRNIIN